MGSEGVLHGFCSDVQAHLKAKAGAFDWTALITALLPVVVSMISTCFNTSADLQAFASGKRTSLQMATLRLRCRQTVVDAGIRGPFRIAAATSSLSSAILAQLDDQAGKCSGEVWEQAFEEAAQAAWFH